MFTPELCFIYLMKEKHISETRCMFLFQLTIIVFNFYD